MEKIPEDWKNKIGRQWKPDFQISSGSLSLDYSDALANYNGIPAGTMIQISSDNEGTFKCHPKGTEVIMYDGTLKDVSEVQVGDKLMGPDSEPRTVLSIGTGKEQCYKVIPNKGESWECNESHTLHLIGSSGKHKGETFNISLKDWLEKSKWFKSDNLLYRPEGINFENKNLPIHPYLLGLWLGDGTSSLSGTVHITNVDEEIENWLYEYCSKNELKLKVHNYPERATKLSLTDPNCSWKTGNKLCNLFKELNLKDNKHIPHEYKTGSKKQRLQLLAGLIDSDGTFASKSKVGYSISQSNYKLCEDIAYVARSLGFTGNIYEYKNKKYNTPFWHVSICGDTQIIPVKIGRKLANKRKQIKNHLRTGFKVKPTKEKKYYGFQLDGDHLYLLKDFTVQHNTSLALQGAKNIQKEQDKKIAFIDAECGLTGLDWIEGMGVLTDEDHWIYAQPESGEEAFEMADFFIEQDDVGGVIIDSIDACVPQKQLDSEHGDADIGIHAKLVTRAIRKYKSLIRTHQTILWLVNQKKVNLTPMGPRGTKSTGGRAINFYCKLNIDMKRTKSEAQLEGERIIPLKMAVKRSKLGQSYIDIPTYAIQGRGIDNDAELKDFAKDLGMIKQAGSWWKEVRDEEENETIGQGLEAIRNWCSFNREEILNKLKERKEEKNDRKAVEK